MATCCKTSYLVPARQPSSHPRHHRWRHVDDDLPECFSESRGISPLLYTYGMILMRGSSMRSGSAIVLISSCLLVAWAIFAAVPSCVMPLALPLVALDHAFRSLHVPDRAHPRDHSRVVEAGLRLGPSRTECKFLGAGGHIDSKGFQRGLHLGALLHQREEVQWRVCIGSLFQEEETETKQICMFILLNRKPGVTRISLSIRSGQMPSDCVSGERLVGPSIRLVGPLFAENITLRPLIRRISTKH